jgi:replicative superfamily II helicase
LPNIGRVRATKLYEAGIKDLKSVASYEKNALKKLLNMKMELVEQIIKEAKDS